MGFNPPFLTSTDEVQSNTDLKAGTSTSGRVAVKVINHLGDEVMKVFRAV